MRRVEIWSEQAFADRDFGEVDFDGADLRNCRFERQQIFLIADEHFAIVDGGRDRARPQHPGRR